MKNVTLSIDDDLLKIGREYARRHNISFNVMHKFINTINICLLSKVG